MNYIVEVNWDSEAGVWCAFCDDIPLAMESNSFDALIARVKIAALEILELNGNLGNGTKLCFKTEHVENIV